uniref:Conotoxin Superfamily O1 n=2 Tax=Conus episcopatus TaxID=88764 RepID=A0A0K2S5T0_CONEP|nr:Conotoxin Superfamily O1 [Conus episcopatus]
MKLTCMMIIAVLFLTAWTFVMADDPRDEPEARDEMNPAASKLNERGCLAVDYFCGIPFVSNGLCCSGNCVFVCTPQGK